MTLTKYSFDTHVLVWYFLGSKILSNKAKIILDEAFLGNNVSFISSVVLLEAFHLSLKDKNFVFKKFIRFLANAKFIIIPLGDEILKISFKLSRYINIHDRVISATAIQTNSILVTKDRIIRRVKEIKTIW